MLCGLQGVGVYYNLLALNLGNLIPILDCYYSTFFCGYLPTTVRDSVSVNLRIVIKTKFFVISAYSVQGSGFTNSNIFFIFFYQLY